jgi:hypothetical protein
VSGWGIHATATRQAINAGTTWNRYASRDITRNAPAATASYHLAIRHTESPQIEYALLPVTPQPTWQRVQPPVVKSVRGAVSAFRPARFLGPLPEPGVPVGQAPGSPQVPCGLRLVLNPWSAREWE